MKSSVTLPPEIDTLLAYISENWEDVKKENITTTSIIKNIGNKLGPYDVLKYVKIEKMNDKELRTFSKAVYIAKNQGVEIITAFDNEYPIPLREYGYGAKVYPPLVLYRLGKPIPNKLMVAVVGTREPTDKGRKLAYEIGAELTRRGYVVVTGFARGVDEEAANGARELGGHVVGVLPYMYEDEYLTELNRNKLLRRLVDEGYDNFTVVSEHLIKKAELVKIWLVARNRIISGMSIAVVIPETKFKKSWGTRHQVKFGIRAGRKVLIVKPQTDDSDIVKGFKEFVNQGAVSVSNIDEIIEYLNKEALKMQKKDETIDRWL